MDDLERLNLLLNILTTVSFERLSSLGKLANDIESLCSVIDVTSESFGRSWNSVWEALEIIGVHHQETGTELTQREEADLRRMVKDLVGETRTEIFNRENQT